MKSLAFFIFGILAICASTASAQFEYTEKQKDGILVNQIAVEMLGVDKLLDELDVTEDQKEELQNKVTEFTDEMSTLNLENLRIARLASEFQLAGKEVDNKLIERLNRNRKLQEAIYRDFPAKLKTDLIGNQYQAFRGVAVQRNILKFGGVETFILPSIVGKDLEMSQDETAVLDDEIKLIRSTFEESQAKANESAWKKINSQIPDEIQSELRGEFQNNLKQFQYVSKTIDPAQRAGNIFLTIEKWEKQDFEMFEKEQFSELVLPLHSDHELKSLLEITFEQSAKMLAMLTEKREPYSAAEIEMLRKLAPLKLKNDTKAVAKLEKKIRVMGAERNHSFALEVANEILIPRQIEFIKKTARLRRLIRESFYGDEFGVVIAIAKSADVPKTVLNQFVKDVEDARDEYYQSLKEFREKAEKDVIQKLPAKSRRLFREKFGPFYDYKAEVISMWDSLRENRD